MSYSIHSATDASSASSANPGQSPLVPATARGEATRRRLLDAAEKEFGDRGFHAASVSSITTRADVGQGTFYLYFRSKEEIFTTLVTEIGHSLRKHMASAITAFGATAPRMDAERVGLEAFLDFAQRHPGLYRIVQEAQFVDEKIFRDYYERLASGYTDALRSAADKGELAPGDAHTRAWAVMGIGHFLGMKHCLWNGELPDAATMNHAMDFIAAGMAPRDPNSKPGKRA